MKNFFVCKNGVYDKSKHFNPSYDLEFAAPEILRDTNYDKRCDVFSAGLILFKFLTGQLPFPLNQLEG